MVSSISQWFAKASLCLSTVTDWSRSVYFLSYSKDTILECCQEVLPSWDHWWRKYIFVFPFTRQYINLEAQFLTIRKTHSGQPQGSRSISVCNIWSCDEFHHWIIAQRVTPSLDIWTKLARFSSEYNCSTPQEWERLVRAPFGSKVIGYWSLLIRWPWTLG